MQGTVLEYDKDNHKGYISGHDGKRYHFATDDWAGKGKIKKGIKVDFDIDDQDEKKARDILSAAGDGKQPSTFGLILGWGLGLFWLAIGVVQFANGLVLTGICAWTASALVFPPVNKFAHNKTGMTIKPWIKVILVILVLLLATLEYQ